MTPKAKALTEYDKKIMAKIKSERIQTKKQSAEAQPLLRDYMKRQSLKRKEGFYNK